MAAAEPDPNDDPALCPADKEPRIKERYNRYGWPLFGVQVFCRSCAHSERVEYSPVNLFTGRPPRDEEEAKYWEEAAHNKWQSFRTHKCKSCAAKTT